MRRSKRSRGTRALGGAVVAAATLIGGCDSGREGRAAGDDPAQLEVAADAAALLLAGAQRAVGAAEAVADARQIDFVAQATGPGGTFTVDMKSARDGRARLEFDGSMVLAIDTDHAWRTGDDGTGTVELTPEERSFVRGHELLMTAVDPSHRWPQMDVGEGTTFEGQAALHLTGVDDLGGTVDAYYSAVDTVLLGFTIEDHLRGAGPVTVSLADRRPVHGILLPHGATFVQGDERFEYALTEVVVRPAIDSVPFASPTGVRPPPGVARGGAPGPCARVAPVSRSAARPSDRGDSRVVPVCSSPQRPRGRTERSQTPA